MIALGIFARVALVVDHSGFATGDQFQYSQLALSLADHLRYSIPLASDPFHWAPGAPSMFAVGLRAFGRGDSGLAGAYTIQAIASIAGLAALYLLTTRLAGRRAALVACAALAISPGAITTASDLITEPLGALLLLAAVALMALLITSDGRGPRAGGLAAAAGLAMGLGILTRPDFLILLPCCLAVVALAWRAPLRSRGRGVTLIVAACAAVVAPYSAFASRTSGELVLPTTSGASSFYVGTYLPADGTTYRTRELLAPEVHSRFPDTQLLSHPRAIDTLRTVAARHPDLPKNAAVATEVRTNLRHYALGHPIAFARMELRKVWRMWGRPYRGHTRVRTWWGNALHAPAILAGILALTGAARWRRRNPALLLIAVVIVVGTAFNSLAAVQPRANTRFLPLVYLGATLVVTQAMRERRRPLGAHP